MLALTMKSIGETTGEESSTWSRSRELRTRKGKYGPEKN